MREVKNFKLLINKFLEKWGVFSPILQFFIIFSMSSLIYFIIFVILPYFLVHKSHLFDSEDKENFVQIALLSGALLAFSETVKLRKVEYEPVLNLYVRDVNSKTKSNRDRLKYVDRCFILNGKSDGKCLAIRNTGKGIAFNVNILKIRNKEDNEYDHNIIFSENIVVNDEVVINLVSLRNTDITGFTFIFRVESVLRDKHFWRFKVEDVNENIVKFVKRYPQ